MPVIAIAPYDRVFDKTVSNVQEVAARGGRLILLVTDAEGAEAAAGQPRMTLVLPTLPATVAPLVYAVPRTFRPLGKADCYTAVTAPTKVFGYLLHVGGG
jgi:glucosamine 6-phosphate synthetase-like amidotransferase/phosphosugar isomerase protein